MNIINRKVVLVGLFFWFLLGFVQACSRGSSRCPSLSLLHIENRKHRRQLCSPAGSGITAWLGVTEALGKEALRK